MFENTRGKKQFGLIGRGIGHSFSRKYFTDRFKTSGHRNYSYINFDIEDISELRTIIRENPNLAGLNVTIPYKESVIPFLDKLSKNAARIGAVNVIRITADKKLKGYNSDSYGFRKSLQPLLRPHHKRALILGTGGAAKAVAFALTELHIDYTFVSQSGTKNAIGYECVNALTLDSHQIVINCTPLGTSPKISECPPIPYDFFTQRHLAYDLIYNPAETLFLKKARKNNAIVKNGLEMLELQAEKSWRIWSK